MFEKLKFGSKEKEEIEKSCNSGGDLIITFIYKPISIYICRLLRRTKITPNQITIFSTIPGLLGAYYVSTGKYFYIILGALLIHIKQLLDNVDGTLARLKNQSSVFGKYLDGLVDTIVIISWWAAFVIGYYNQTSNIKIF